MKGVLIALWKMADQKYNWKILFEFDEWKQKRLFNTIFRPSNSDWGVVQGRADELS